MQLSCISGSWDTDTITISWAQNSPTNCMWACQLRNFQVAGVTAGNQCVCSRGFSIDIDQQAPSTSCNLPCSGDSSQTCGGRGFTTLYNTDFDLPRVQELPAGQPQYHVSIPCAVNSADGIVSGGPVFSLPGNNSATNCIDYCLQYGLNPYPTQVSVLPSQRLFDSRKIRLSRSAMALIVNAAVGP